MERLTSEPPPRRAAGWLRGVNEVVHSAISSFLSVPHAPKLLAVHLGWCYGSKAALNCCYWSTVTLYMLKALILHNVGAVFPSVTSLQRVPRRAPPMHCRAMFTHAVTPELLVWCPKWSACAVGVVWERHRAWKFRCIERTRVLDAFESHLKSFLRF